MFNINSQGILKDVVKTDLKVFNISNFNFIKQFLQIADSRNP